MATFSAQVDAWVTKSLNRLVAIIQTSAQYLIGDILYRTPVDTGYLRAGFTVSTGGLLPLTGQQGDGYSAPPYALVLSGVTPGETIYGSFVASYAGYVEYVVRGGAGVGMVRLSVQNWQQHVNQAVADAQARFR